MHIFSNYIFLQHLGCSHKVSVEVTVEDVVPYPAIDFSSDLNAVVIKRKPGVFGCSGPALVQVRYTCARNHWKKPQWKPWPSWKPANNYRVPENSWKASKGRAEELSDVVVPEDVGMLENIKTISDERKPIYFSDPWVRHDDGMQEGDYLPRYLREIRIQKNAKEPKPRDPKKADIVALHKAPLHL